MKREQYLVIADFYSTADGSYITTETIEKDYSLARFGADDPAVVDAVADWLSDDGTDWAEAYVEFYEPGGVETYASPVWVSDPVRIGYPA